MQQEVVLMHRDFNMIGWKKRVAFVELIILVFSSLAFPYVVSEATLEENSFLFDILEGIMDELNEPMIPFVSAASVNGCCLRTVAGEDCAIVSSAECTPGESFAPGVVCESSSFCERGCCYDEDAGIYDESVLEARCGRGDWVADPFCNLPGAALGCCIMGDSTKFRTEGQCRVLTEVYAFTPGFDVDWRTGLDDVGCALLAGEQGVGACVLPDSDCEFGTEVSCFAYDGEYAEEILCTAPELNTTCKMSEETTCVDGKDQVFFKDTCGNIANIYDKSKAKNIDYWTNYVKPKEACNAPNGAANSKSCGNCNRFEGGICALAKPDNFNVDMGDYYCKDSSCDFKDGWGVTHHYKNGEAWCVYDGPIDKGDDVPGSRHFRYVCNSGVVKVEPCADYRNEICVQKNTLKGEGAEIVSDGGGEVQFHNAICRKNNAKNCIDIGEQSMAACRDEPDCMVRHVEVGGSFSFSICVPMYPEGFSFESQYQASGSQVCSIATRTCVVTFEPLPFCIPVDNAGCLFGGLKPQMDEVCAALGDCGSSKNYYQDSPLKGDVVDYDPRVEKYMLAAGLSSDDYLGVGSALFEQSAFSGAMFAKKLDTTQQSTSSSGSGGGGGGAGAALAAVGAALAALAGILASTLMAVAGAVMSAIGAIASAAQPQMCPPVIVPYSCNLWEAPTGSAGCEACNTNPDVPCTEYRCGSLGTGCDFINKGTSDARCAKGVNDGSFPVMTPIYDISEIIQSENLIDFPDLLAFVQNVTYKRVGDGHLRITNLNGGCIKSNTPVPISFTTQKEAQCRLAFEEIEFEDMEIFVGANTHIKNHVTFFRMPDPSHGESQGIDIQGDMTIYIKCRDRFGNENPEYLKIESCVFEGPDETVPIVGFFEPKSESFVSYSDDNVSIGFVTNEFSSCKWDYDSSVSYESMQFSLGCENVYYACKQRADKQTEYSSECDKVYLESSNPFGYFCEGVLPINKSTSNNIFYIKCSDQPWLEGSADEGKRNSMVEPYEYVLIRPEGKIFIDSLSHEGELVTTADLMTVPFTIMTSGGAEEHTCSYSQTGYDTMIPCFETGYSGRHFQPFDLSPGNYDIFVECVDETGDSVRDKTSIRVLKKSTSPLIARIWQDSDSNNLYFITQEEASCVYSEDGCGYSFDEGAALSGDGIKHRISAVKGMDYYVKCKDDLGNVPSGCSVVLSAV